MGFLGSHLGSLELIWRISVNIYAKTEKSYNKISGEFFEKICSPLIGNYLGFPWADFDQILM